MNERDGASASLTSGGLRSLIAAPKKLVSCIQDAFTLEDGSRISLEQAVLFAVHVISHFVQRGTCAVALPVCVGVGVGVFVGGSGSGCVWVCGCGCTHHGF